MFHLICAYCTSRETEAPKVKSCAQGPGTDKNQDKSRHQGLLLFVHRPWFIGTNAHWDYLQNLLKGGFSCPDPSIMMQGDLE